MDTGADLLWGWIARAAQRFPDKPWIIPADGGPAVTYGQLKDVTGRIATFLSERGIGRNDRVALLADNSVEHLICYFGLMAYGATICTVHVEMHRNQLDNIFQRLNPKLILYQADLGLDDLFGEVPVSRLPLGAFEQSQTDTFFGAISALPPSDAQTDAGPDDNAVILFTSGTGDRPKGVVLSFREHLANIDPTAESFGIGADDRVYDFRSFNWASAQLLGALVPVNRAATLVMARKFSASRFFDHLRDHRVTVATGNPTTINILLNSEQTVHRDELSALRFVTSSSAPLPVEEWRRFENRFGIPIAQGYGSTETGWIAAMSGEVRRFGTVGRPFAYHSLTVVDEKSGNVPCGQSGQIEIGGFAGHVYRYLGEDGSVKPHARERIRTGDIGHLDPEGFLTLTGRDKELIIRGGVNISPVEMDGFLLRHPELIEAATIGVPDAIYGEEIVAYVVARPGARIGDEDVLRFCGAELPAFKTPKRIVLCASLPKTERGKLDRKALRQRWLEQGPH